MQDKKFFKRVGMVMGGFATLLLAFLIFNKLVIQPRSEKVVPRSLLRKDFGSGIVVLVNKARAFGAFQITRQGYGPMGEQVGYRWVFREDGGTKLDAADPAVKSGEVQWEEGKAAIEFGPFNVHWSASSSRRGYLKYDRKYNEPVQMSDQRLCVTRLKTLEGIDAGNKKWKYKASTKDRGLASEAIEAATREQGNPDGPESATDTNDSPEPSAN